MRALHGLSWTALIVAAGALAPIAAADHRYSDAVFLIEAAPGADKSNYATPAMVVPQGGRLDFVNHDIAFHNVVAMNDLRPDGSATWCARYVFGQCPLFWSPNVPLLGRTPVHGLDDVEALTVYSYTCTLHKWMEGTLVVLP